jgi:tetratricopeptide (TPR) repeat protein
MVVGEPGIGKTAVCEQLATYVTLRGGKALVGHCYEEGSLSLPYLAFVEALRSYVLTRDASDLKKELGNGASDVARIVSEIREKVQVTPKAAGDPEEDRYRLLQAVTDFLGNASNIQPMLIVLEDLHDADRGTLEMLSYIARFLAGKRLMIIGTYRDIEVDRSHPLSAALAEFRRLPSFGRVLLRGLNADEVRRMLNSITGQEVPWGLAEAVHRQTEGNPLFVQEVIRYLVEEGLLTRDKGQWKSSRDTPVEMQIPEGLRDVIGKRVSSLSKECNRILSIASVIGREFRLDILKKVADLPDEELFNALEEAKKAAVIEERSAVGAAITYRFAHAFFRQTLYEEIIAPRRIRLHQQVGRAIEEVYASRLEEHAAELAEHFSQSSESADLVKAVSYGEMAAKRAVSVYAYAEAIRLLEQAIRVQEILDPADKEKRCDLLISLCEVLYYAAEYRRVIDTEAPMALKLAEEMGDSRRAAAACRFAMMALREYGLMTSMATPEYASWVNKLNANAQPGTEDKGWAELGLGQSKIATGDYDEGIAAVERAVNLGRSLSRYELFIWAAYQLYGPTMPPGLSEDGIRVTEELLASPARSINPERWFLLACITYLAAGKRKEAEEISHEYQEFARSRQRPHTLMNSMLMDSILLAMDGHLEEAVESGQKLFEFAEEMGPGSANLLCGFCSTMPVYFLGRTGEHLPGTEYPKEANHPGAWAHRALIQAHLGKYAEVIGIIEKNFISRHKAGLSDANASCPFLMLWLEAAVLAGHYPAVELLFGWLKDTGYVTTGRFYTTSVQRHLGSAAVLLGKYDEARRYYQKALEVTTQMRFRPELALTHLQAAELLLEHFPREKAEATAHLDTAIPELRDMKMKPFLEKAMKLKVK